MKAKETIYSFVQGFGQDVSASSHCNKTEEMVTINVSCPTGATFFFFVGFGAISFITLVISSGNRDLSYISYHTINIFQSLNSI